MTAKPSTNQKGFSLIELMVAVTISLLIFAAVLRLFLDIGRTNDELSKTNEQIENGRFSIQLLQLDLMHAGFWDGYIPEYDDPAATGGLPPAATAAVCDWEDTDTYKYALLSTPIQIFPDVPTGCGGVITDKLADTDVIVTRHADTCVAGSAGCEADTAGELYIQVSRCGSDTARYVLGQTGDATFDLLKRDCNPAELASKRRFVSHIYYIKDEGGVPTLMRSTLEDDGGTPTFSTPQALIEGVESLRVELGVDDFNSQTGEAVNYITGVRGDGVPDRYLNTIDDCTTGCTINDLVNATSASVYVLVRSTQASPGYTDTKSYQLGPFTIDAANDNFKRHVFSTNVRFHNISGRREVPAAFAGSSTETDPPTEEPTP